MISAQRTRRLRSVLVCLLIAVMLLVPLAAPPHAQAADAGLVIEALGVLRSRYVDQVDPVALLNGAIGGLRQALSGAGMQADLADIAQGTSPAPAEGLFRERFDAASTAATGRVTQTALAYAAIQGMTAVLNDSHTGFIGPEANRERQLRQQGQAGFSGIGVVLMPREGRYYVRDVIPGGPAQTAGVQALDRIVRIDNVPTAGLATDQVSGMIRGPAGSSVTILVERPGRSEPVTITVIRGPIQVPAVFQARVLDGGVGYLQFYQFVARSGQDFREALERLLAGNMRALVLDVRGNNGGFLHELTAVVNTLLPAGRPIYQETTRGGVTRTTRTGGVPVLPPHIPMVLIVDEGSASAAELLSAALQENDRAVLVGARTSGAVEASILVDLSDGSALSVTVLRLTSGQGRRLENAGVTPDVEVALSSAELDQGRDAQFLRAILIARQRLGQVQAFVPAARR
jgi:carboxyl-terminal processing protease